MTQEEKEAAAKKEFQISENTTEGDKGKLEWLQEIFIRGLTHRDTEVEELKEVIRDLVNLKVRREALFEMDAENDMDLISQKSDEICRDEVIAWQRAKQIIEK